MGSELKIQLPTALIEDSIRAEIVRQFPDKEKLATRIIEEALTQKADRYSRSDETLFGAAVKAMIREEAQKIFGEWVEENRDLIRKAFVAELKRDKHKRLAGMVDSLLRDLSRFSVSVSLNRPRDG